MIWCTWPACPEAAAGAEVAANAAWGAAASTPATATAGAASLALRATFSVWDGAVCRPVLRNFLFLLRDFPAFKTLPYADPAPSYAATCVSHRA